MQRIFYLMKKEFKQILREKLFISLIFLAPLGQIIILGFAITTDVRNLNLAVVDADHSSMSARLIESLSATESFNLVCILDSEKEALREMDNGKIKLAVVIPKQFERDLKNGRQPQVQAIIDGVDGNSAGIAMAYIGQISRKLQQEWMQKTGVSNALNQDLRLVEIETRMWYNPSLESVNNIVPGIIAVLVMMITAFLTGMTIVREKENGTLEQLMVTPITSMELMLGKVLPLVIVGFILFNVGILGAGIVFGLWMKGNLFSLYLMAIVFMLSTLGLGIFASTVSQTQQQAMFIAWFFMIVALLLSGFFIPIENMPDWVQALTYLNPVRYFMVIIREIYLKGTELLYLWKEALAMLAFGLATIISAAVRFQKRMS
ncbi:MAG: ABC transporter permease [Calditrichaceae bacterium]|nr:ABC transporter permease [Calditrichaceae bacterium]MBN2708039.1 ABC transporter permease [Calditrichaceae bacterium]RQV95162.1 MAG: ABC transporter permease [Calditrichota bacterium]